MDKNQKINCTVSSCRFNNCKNQECKLNQITVEPMDDCQTCTPDESMCGSYEHNDEGEE